MVRMVVDTKAQPPGLSVLRDRDREIRVPIADKITTWLQSQVFFLARDLRSFVPAINLNSLCAMIERGHKDMKRKRVTVQKRVRM